MGYVHFVRYHNSALFENIFFRINVNGFKLVLEPKKTLLIFTVSADIGATSSITSNKIFV